MSDTQSESENPADNSTSQNVSRRKFLKWGLGGAAGASGIGYTLFKILGGPSDEAKKHTESLEFREDEDNTGEPEEGFEQGKPNYITADEWKNKLTPRERNNARHNSNEMKEMELTDEQGNPLEQDSEFAKSFSDAFWRQPSIQGTALGIDMATKLLGGPIANMLVKEPGDTSELSSDEVKIMKQKSERLREGIKLARSGIKGTEVIGVAGAYGGSVALEQVITGAGDLFNAVGHFFGGFSVKKASKPLASGLGKIAGTAAGIYILRKRHTSGNLDNMDLGSLTRLDESVASFQKALDRLEEREAGEYKAQSGERTAASDRNAAGKTRETAKDNAAAAADNAAAAASENTAAQTRSETLQKELAAQETRREIEQAEAALANDMNETRAVQRLIAENDAAIAASKLQANTDNVEAQLLEAERIRLASALEREQREDAAKQQAVDNLIPDLGSDDDDTEDGDED